MTELEPKEKITRAKVQLQNKSPFFSYLVMNMKIKESNGETPTMGVDPKGNLYYNPEFVEKLDDEQVEGVLCHETLHVALKTALRGDDRDPMLWNLASDFVINEKVKKNGFKLPEGIAYDSKYSDMCAEEVYSRIKSEMPDSPKREKDKNGENKGEGEQNGQGNGSSSGDGEGEEKSPNKGSQDGKKTDKDKKDDKNGGKSEERKKFEEKAEKKYGKQFDDHLEGDGEGEEGELSEEEKREIEEEWERKVVEAHQHSQKRGKKPAGLETLIEDILDSKLDWRSILRKYIKKEVPYDFTYASPHKKSKATGFYMPNIKRESLEVIVHIDTSGSISNEMLQQFLGEIKEIAKSHESVNMTIIQADATIQDTFELRNGNMKKLDNMEMKGRGGTDHRPVFRWIRENKTNARVVVSLTDGYSKFPEKTTVRNILWIVPETGAEKEEFPYGKVIKMPN